MLRLCCGATARDLLAGLWVFWTLCLIGIAQGAGGTSVAAKNGLRFIINGDWGGIPRWPYHSSVQRMVADQMTRIAQENAIDFVISTGDNFYEDGVKNEFDDRFEETFESVYTSPSLHVPWYAILGNHDYQGNTSAQIAYTNISKRWHLPDYNYTLHFTLPGSIETVTMVMIDTAILCGVTLPGNKPLPGPSDPQWAKRKLAWIEEQLKNAQSSDYVLVVGHYPIFSVGLHGSGGCMPDIVLPMLYKYTVNAYICGHDHNVQHLTSVSDGWALEHLLVGAGARIESRKNHKNVVATIASHFFSPEPSGAFAFVEMNSEHANVAFINGEGANIYSTTLKKRKPKSIIETGAVPKGDENENVVEDKDKIQSVEKEEYPYWKTDEKTVKYAGMYIIP